MARTIIRFHYFSTEYRMLRYHRGMLHFVYEQEIQKVLTMPMTLEAVEFAFRSLASGKVQMPPKMYLFFPESDGDLRVMPAYIPAIQLAGVKIVSVHPRNDPKILRTVMATIILIDPKTGERLCVMDGTWITNMRTGAAGGVAVKCLARKDSKVLGLVGAGAQAETQFLAIREVLPIQEVKIWSLDSKKTELFIEHMSSTTNIKFEVVSNAKDACDADIICTTTPSRDPVVRSEWIAPGTHINAIGADAPGKEELDPALLHQCIVVIDDWEQAVHSGEVNVPIQKQLFSKDKIRGTLGDIILGKVPGRKNDNEITIFDSTGLAIQDLATAHSVLEALNLAED